MCLSNTNASNSAQFQVWPRSQGQIPEYQYKNLATRNADVQYEISNIYNTVLNNGFLFKDMSNVLV